MAEPKIEVLAEQLEKAQKETLHVAEGVPEGARLKQLQEGKATPLWLIGHLANTINSVVLRWMLDTDHVLTKEQTKLFGPDFAGGTPPATDAAIYPPWEEVVGRYDSAMRRAVQGVRDMRDDDLPRPLKGNVPDAMRQFFSSNQVTLYQMVQHDAYHRGQISLLSKLGEPV